MLWKRPHIMIQTWLMVAGLPRCLTGGSLRLAWLIAAEYSSSCRFCWSLIIFLECVSAREYCVRFTYHAPQWGPQRSAWRVNRTCIKGGGKCCIVIRRLGSYKAARHAAFLQEKLSASYLYVHVWRQSLQSLNWLAGASSQCLCIRQYFGWHADTGNRDQLLGACDRFFVLFFGNNFL